MMPIMLMLLATAHVCMRQLEPVLLAPQLSSAGGRAAVAKDLTAATKLWRDFGMPVLSPTSKPVILTQNDSRDEANIAFTDRVGGRPGCLLVGTMICDPSDPNCPLLAEDTEGVKAAVPADWTETTARRLQSDGWYNHTIFPTNAALCAAILSEIAGRHDFAMELLEKVNLNPEPLLYIEMYLGIPIRPTVLAGAAMEIELYLGRQALDPISDRSAILGKLEPLLATHLIDLRGRRFVGFPEGLRAAVAIRPPKPGTPEAAVVDLTSADVRHAWDELDDEHCVQILSFGLTAIPALARHIGDPALTRARFEGEDNDPQHIIEIGEVVQALIVAVSDGEIGGPDTQFTKQQVLDWYRARLAGRLEPYLLKNLTWVEFDGISRRVESSERTFTILAKDHHELLTGAYRSLLNTSVEMRGADNGISKAGVATSKIIQLLTMASKSRTCRQRVIALDELASMDKAEFNRDLAEALNPLLPDPYDRCLMWLAYDTDDTSVWSAVEEGLRMCDGKLRSKLIADIDREPGAVLGPAVKLRILHALRAFIDDKVAGKAAIVSAARVLGFSSQPQPTSDVGWQDLRHQVLKAIAP